MEPKIKIFAKKIILVELILENSRVGIDVQKKETDNGGDKCQVKKFNVWYKQMEKNAS